MENAEILICENEALVAADLQKRIESFGHVVTAVSSTGEEAIQLARRLRPDIALMDIKLDGKMSGVDTAQVLDKELQIPSIFLTAYADSGTIENATASHPVGYLVKPVGDAELRAAIEIGLSLKFRLALLNISRSLYASSEAGEKAYNKQSLSYDNGSLQYIPSSPLLNAMNLSCGYAGFHVSKLLSPLSASLSWLAQCGTLQAFELRHVTEGLKQLEIVESLVKKLRWCSRLGVSRFTFELVPDIVLAVIAKLNPQFSDALKVTFEIAEDSEGEEINLLSYVDQIALAEALSALIVNAAESQNGTGEIKVRCGVATPAVRSNEDTTPTDAYVTVAIQDQGSGILVENVPRIFEPFYTTKDSIDALGLGLAVTYGVIAAHKGWVEAACTRDKGCKFTVYLPQAEKGSRTH